MDNSLNQTLTARAPAASAGAVTSYLATAQRPFMCHGYSWFYESAEANVDNELYFNIAYSTDGTNFTDVIDVANATAPGLLNTSAPLVVNDRRGNAASEGAAAAAVDTDFGPVRIPAGAVIRFTLTTEGTGTIPACNVQLDGAYV